MVGIDERREGVDRLAVQQDIELRQLRGLVARAMVVERGVSLRDALQLVVEVEDDLREGISKLISIRLPDMYSCLMSSPRLPRQSSDKVGYRAPRSYTFVISGSPEGLCTSDSLR